MARDEHVFQNDADRVPDEALELAAAYLRGKPVGLVAELRTVRVKREFRDEDGADVAEVVEDDVHVVENAKVGKRFRQLEIELEDGVDESALDAVETALRGNGAGAPDPTPKDVRAVGDAAAEPEIAIPPLDADSHASELVRAALGKAVTQFIRSDAKIRTSDDAEAVHDARVAIRRVRSHLRSFRPLLECDWAENLRERLSWLQDQLSLARDADVFAEFLHRLSDRLPHADREGSNAILETLREAQKKAHVRVRAALHEKQYVELLNDLVEAARAPRTVAMAEERGCDVMGPIMQSVWKRSRKAARGAGRTPSDRDLHLIRIKSKHLRYAAEAFSCVAGSAATDFARLVEDLQTLLGNQHDGVVATKRLREMEGPSNLRFAAGEFAMLADEAQCEARQEWRKAWSCISRKRVRFW